MLRQHRLREVVVLSVQQDEFDLVVGAQEAQVRICLVRLHAGSRALDVHDISHTSRGPFPRQARVECSQVDLAVRLEGMHESLWERANRAGNRRALEEGLSPGPTRMP